MLRNCESHLFHCVCAFDGMSVWFESKHTILGIFYITSIYSNLGIDVLLYELKQVCNKNFGAAFVIAIVI